MFAMLARSHRLTPTPGHGTEAIHLAHAGRSCYQRIGQDFSHACCAGSLAR